MLNLADFLVACFIFLLFVSIYRKRSSASVRFWVTGWFCILLHFATLCLRPRSVPGELAQAVMAVTTLLVGGTAFVLSLPQSHLTRARQVTVSSLLILPWLLVVSFGLVVGPGQMIAAGCCAVSHVCVLAVAYKLVGLRSRRFVFTCCMVTGCATWLIYTVRTQDLSSVVPIALTLCFGLVAVLLSGRSPLLSAANLTTSFGATSWAFVWIAGSAASKWLPGQSISPEIWNLPKYFLAAGMVLSLLDEEIRRTERDSEEYRMLFAGNPQPMWIYDASSLAILEVNDSAVAHYGFSEAEFHRLSLPDLVHSAGDTETFSEFTSPLPQKLSGPWLHKRKDGSEFPVETASQPVWRDGRRATFALMHDVTAAQRLQAQLFRQAHHDALTGLPNRTLFEQRVSEELSRAAEEEHLAALFCIDLDRFKQINDTYGHSAGDRCLCDLAERVHKRLQGAGTLARTGGDEFMLVVGGLKAAETAEHMATLLLYDLKDAVHLENGEVDLSVSIGIAVYPDDGLEGTHLWRDADVAMYQAKRAGGGRWVRVSREISRVASEANEIELRVRRALKTNGLALHYQPQMTAAGDLHSLEALVRFHDPLLKATPADRVIGIAEESGLIVPLGDWVLEEVCRQSREWIDAELPPMRIAWNVSPLQLTRSNFSLKVAAALERYHLSPRLLECEVTESTVMPDRGEAPAQIELLARMGVRFSVDDFGAGYSSLGRLHQLPVEALKIDASFVRWIGQMKGTYPTVRAIIGLAHSFGLQVVAEGVETEDQLRILRSLKCDRVQGFLFSKPLPAEEIFVMLQRELCSSRQQQQAV